MADSNWSNRLASDWAPTRDAVSEAIARVERDAYLYTSARLPGKVLPGIPQPHANVGLRRRRRARLD